METHKTQKKPSETTETKFKLDKRVILV